MHKRTLKCQSHCLFHRMEFRLNTLFSFSIRRWSPHSFAIYMVFSSPFYWILPAIWRFTQNYFSISSKHKRLVKRKRRRKNHIIHLFYCMCKLRCDLFLKKISLFSIGLSNEMAFSTIIQYIMHCLSFAFYHHSLTLFLSYFSNLLQ